MPKSALGSNPPFAAICINGSSADEVSFRDGGANGGVAPPHPPKLTIDVFARLPHREGTGDKLVNPRLGYLGRF